jgi:hypothetical protein
MDILGIEQKFKNSIEIMKAKLRGHTVYPFEGQDAMMWVKKSLRHTNALSSYIRISEENPIRGEALYDDIKGRVKRYIEEKGSKGVCRARWYEPYDRLYVYSDESVDTIVDQLVLRGSERMDDHALSELVVDVPVRWVVYENSYHYVTNHQFVDGCVYAELLSVPMDDRAIDWKMIPEFTYIPGVTELVGVGPGIGGMLKALPKIGRNLSVDSDWRVCCARKHTQPPTQLSIVKWIKQYITDQYGKIPYSLVLACISTWNIMRCTDKNQLTVGIAGAFRDARAARFNNFAATTLPVNCPDGFRGMDIATQFHHVVKQFVEYVPLMKSQMVAVYLATNVYDLNYYVNDKIDVLVSCAPTSVPIKYDGNDCELVSTTIHNSSMPVYYGWWNSGTAEVTNTVITRSNEVDASNIAEVGVLMDALK